MVQFRISLYAIFAIALTATLFQNCGGMHSSPSDNTSGSVTSGVILTAEQRVPLEDSVKTGVKVDNTGLFSKVSFVADGKSIELEFAKDLSDESANSMSCHSDLPYDCYYIAAPAVQRLKVNGSLTAATTENINNLGLKYEWSRKPLNALSYQVLNLIEGSLYPPGQQANSPFYFESVRGSYASGLIVRSYTTNGIFLYRPDLIAKPKDYVSLEGHFKAQLTIKDGAIRRPIFERIFVRNIKTPKLEIAKPSMHFAIKKIELGPASRSPASIGGSRATSFEVEVFLHLDAPVIIKGSKDYHFCNEIGQPCITQTFAREDQIPQSVELDFHPDVLAAVRASYNRDDYTIGWRQYLDDIQIPFATYVQENRLFPKKIGHSGLARESRGSGYDNWGFASVVTLTLPVAALPILKKYPTIEFLQYLGRRPRMAYGENIEAMDRTDELTGRIQGDLTHVLNQAELLLNQ